MESDTKKFDRPAGPVDNPGNWTREEVLSGGWRTQWPQQVVDELLTVVQSVKSSGLVLPNITMHQFPAEKTAEFMRDMLVELEDARGFAVISGLPIADLTQEECEILFLGIGLQLGRAVPINAKGDLMGHVRDLGFDINHPTVRNYQTTEELKLHNDSCDILGLLCLRNAKSGGESAIASATAIHNEILATRPDLLEALYQPLAIDRRGEKGWPAEGDCPWYALPVFSYFDGLVTARYTVHEYYYASQKFPDAPRLTAIQQEALEYLKTVARAQQLLCIARANQF